MKPPPAPTNVPNAPTPKPIATRTSAAVSPHATRSFYLDRAPATVLTLRLVALCFDRVAPAGSASGDHGEGDVGCAGEIGSKLALAGEVAARGIDARRLRQAGGRWRSRAPARRRRPVCIAADGASAASRRAGADFSYGAASHAADRDDPQAPAEEHCGRLCLPCARRPGPASAAR